MDILKKLMIFFPLNKAYILSLFSSCRHKRKYNLAIKAEQTPCVLLGTVFWHFSPEASKSIVFKEGEALWQQSTDKEKPYQRKYHLEVADIKRICLENSSISRKSEKNFFHNLKKKAHISNQYNVSYILLFFARKKISSKPSAFMHTIQYLQKILGLSVFQV